ncbi:PTS transporter subunit EIIC, partial [Streptococcus pneumoniae]|uniref:PTS transporter subunit EIIC n=1 Tax=Streptococcus pneumoniae TaxID=1313 RepID=UPI000B192253
AFILINRITGTIFGVSGDMLKNPDAMVTTFFGGSIKVADYFISVLEAPALNMGVFVGIISGFVGATAYNKYYNFRKLPDALSFFNGKRFVPFVVILRLLDTVHPARFKVGQMIGSFGILMGVIVAIYRNVDADKKHKYKGMMIATALATFLTGVTEPIEYMFMFIATPMYLVYSLVQGAAFAMADVVNLRMHS